MSSLRDRYTQIMLNIIPGLDWPLCHGAIEQWLAIVEQYDGTVTSPRLLYTKILSENKIPGKKLEKNDCFTGQKNQF